MGYLDLPRVSYRLFLIDIRRGLTEEDFFYLKMISHSGETALVLTKADKMSKNQSFSAAQKQKKVLKEHGLTDIEVYVTSSLKKLGTTELRESLLSLQS